VAAALIVVPNVMKKGGPSAPGAAPGPGGPGKTATETVYSVRTQELKTGSLRNYLELTGDVVTDTNVAIFADAGGKLTEVLAKVGDSVVKGKTLIANVDPSKPGASYSLSPVYSPLTGTITALTAQQGATVSTSDSLGTVGILTNLLVESKVPETQVASVRTGLFADVTFEAYPGKIFRAVVNRVDPVVDTASRTKTIRLKFLGSSEGVDLGMFARVKLYFDNRDPAVLAPQESVVTRSGKNYVFVLPGDTAVRRDVTLGLAVDGTVEVLTGVKAGEVLVVKGQELLDDGTKVKVVK
jgi:multidrug efflux pump subunit AcrA (membrane-fusion protein)